MKKQLSLCLLLLAFSLTTWSQTEKVNVEAQRALKDLAFLTGKWAGNGWIYTPDGAKRTFDQTEHIQFKLDGTLLLIEGMGKTNGMVTHNALALVTYNKETKKFNFRSYLAEGREGTFPAELKNNALHWFPNANMRYIIKLNEKGQWFETGEMKRGEEWMQFFEMTLDKVGG